MMNHANPLSGAIADAIVPAKELIIGSGQAWLLLVVLLILCCTTLWFLTQPTNGNVPVRRSPHDGSPRRHGRPTYRRARRGRGSYGRPTRPVELWGS